MVDYCGRYTAMNTVSCRFLLLCDKFFFAYSIYVGGLFIKTRTAEKTVIEPERGGDSIASKRTIHTLARRYVIARDQLLDLITLIDTTVST